MMQFPINIASAVDETPFALFKMCLSIRATGSVCKQTLEEARILAPSTSEHILRAAGAYSIVDAPVALEEQKTSHRAAFDGMIDDCLEECDDDTLVSIAAELWANDVACLAVNDEAENRGLPGRTGAGKRRTVGGGPSFMPVFRLDFGADVGWSKVLPFLERITATIDARREGVTRDMPSTNIRAFRQVRKWVYRMSSGHELYERMRGFVEAYATRTVPPVLQRSLENHDYMSALGTELNSFLAIRHEIWESFEYLDHSYTRHQNVPSVSMVVLLAFEKAALSVAMNANTLPSYYAMITVAYVRSSMTKSTIRLIHPEYELESSLHSLAGGRGPAWAKDITGERALAELVPNVRMVARTLAAVEDGNPYVHWSSRWHLARLVTNFSFLHRMDEIIPTPDDPVVSELLPGLHRLIPAAILGGHEKPVSTLMLAMRIGPRVCMSHDARAEIAHKTATLQLFLARSQIQRCGLAVRGLCLERHMFLRSTPVSLSEVGRRNRDARQAAAIRPYQLLLLATILSRGADSDDPLCTPVLINPKERDPEKKKHAAIYMCDDVCSVVRYHLHVITALPQRMALAENFAWH